MFTLNLQTKFQTRTSNDSLVILIKQKAKNTFHPAVVLFYIMLRKSYLTKYAYFLRSITKCYTSIV
jgi:hypothetical protein